MLLSTDYINPADLTGYVRAALADREANQFSLNRFLPNRLVDDLTYRFLRGGAGLTEAATFRAYDAESSIAGRVGVERVTGELPPISRKIRMGEYDSLRQRRLDGAIRGQIMSDAVNMVRSVAARIELARGEALATGAVSIAEDGLVVEADFGRDPSHTVGSATPWSDDQNAQILSELITWRDKYEDTNGVAPGTILTSRKVLARMLRNAEIRKLAATVAGTPTLVPQAALQQTLQAYGLPPVQTYDAKVSVGGSAQRVIDEDLLLMLPPAVDADAWEDTELGATFWGTTAEALDPSFQIEESEAPGIVAGSYRTEDPVAVWTKAAAISLPVLANPDLSLAADTEAGS